MTKTRSLPFVCAAAALGGCVASGDPGGEVDGMRTQLVDLEDEGLSPGDDITPFLERHWESGAEVHIPAGTYELSDPDALGLSAGEDSWLVGDGDVVLDHGSTDNNWTLEANGDAVVRIENITLRGVIDGEGGKIRPFPVDEESVVEFVNFNRPDGCRDGTESSGFYVPGETQGTSRIVNCHIEGFSDNGIYASSPGKEGLGTTEVYGGLYKNNDTSGVRLGGVDDKAIGVVIVNDAHAPGVSGGNCQRGLRIREPGPVTVRNVDITHFDVDGVCSPIDVESDKFYSDREGGLTLENVRIRNESGSTALVNPDSGYSVTGSGVHLSGSGDLELENADISDVTRGSSADRTRTTKRVVDPGDVTSREGMPGDGATDEEPMDGGSMDDGSGCVGDLGGGEFVVQAVDGGPKFTYEFTADAPMSKAADTGRLSADDNDTVTDNGDGTYTVRGEVGNGFGDTFRGSGPIYGWSATTDPMNYILSLDGHEIAPGEVSGSGDCDGGVSGSDGGVSGSDGGASGSDGSARSDGGTASEDDDRTDGEGDGVTVGCPGDAEGTASGSCPCGTPEDSRCPAVDAGGSGASSASSGGGCVVSYGGEPSTPATGWAALVAVLSLAMRRRGTRVRARRTGIGSRVDRTGTRRAVAPHVGV